VLEIGYDSALGNKATAAEAIEANEWRWTLARSDDLLEPQMALCGLISPYSGFIEKVVFTGSSTGSFSVKEAWKLVRKCGNKVN